MAYLIVNVPTLIAYTATLFVVLGVLLFVFWVRDMRARWLLWFSPPFVLAAAASVLLIDHIAPALPAVWVKRLAAGFIMLAYGFVWQAVRVFYGRRPVVGIVLLCIAAWMLATSAADALLPGSAAGLALLLAIDAAFNALAAREFWRARSEPLPSRPALFGVFAVYAVFAAARIPLSPFLPAPLGHHPPQAWAVIVYNIAIITQALLVTAFMIALSRERVALQNYRLATRDPLTGAFNRRAFDEQAGPLVQAQREAGMPLTLLLFDLDHFKTVNDRFGHEAGDMVIRHAAQTARQMLRPQDRVFRMGGEEFVCLLPGIAAAQAFMIAERLRRTFQASAEVVAGHAVCATLSIGLASTEATRWQAEHLLARADAALYEAKRSGRNRSVLASVIAGTPSFPVAEVPHETAARHG